KFILGARVNHTVVYDGEHHNPPGVLDTVLTGPGISEEPLVFRVAPPAIVSGTVRDEYGDPLPGASVHLLREHWQDVHLSFYGAEGAIADDRGRFRVAGIQPGTFRLCANADGKTAAVVGTLDFDSRDVQQTYAPACHPGANGRFQIVSGEKV